MNYVNPNALELLLTGQIDWLSDSFRVALINSDYGVSPTDLYLDDIIPGSAIIADEAIVPTTATNGVADAADTIVTLAPGDTVRYAWVYRDSGSPATSELIAYIDSDDAGTPLNYTGTGADMTLRWSNSDNRVFRI